MYLIIPPDIYKDIGKFQSQEASAVNENQVLQKENGILYRL